MSIRRTTPSSATLTGGDLSVDVLHTEDSVRLGDGTNLMGAMASHGGVRALPIDVLATVGVVPANLTAGTARSKITDGVDNVEIDDVGGEKALKVSVIASVGGGGGGTAATDSAAYTATSSQFTPIGGAFDDASSDALAEGEMGMCRVTSDRALHVQFQNTSLAVTGTFWQATQPVSGTFWQATQPVSGTFWQATQPVSAASLPLPSGAATEAKQDTQLTALQLIDDPVFVDDAAFTAATSKVMMIGGQYQSSPNALDDGDAGSILLDSSHRQVVVVATAPTTAVTGTFWQATQPISGTVTINAIPAGTNNIGDVDVLTLPALPAGSNNIGDVDVLTMPTVTVVGSAAHDNGSPGVPMMMAGRANNANPTAVAAGDVSYINTDLAGRQIVSFSDRALVTRSATITVTNTTETSVIAAGGSNVFHDITCMVITNVSAVGSRADIRDATGGTIQFAVYVPANGGIVIPFPVPLNQTTANSAWTIQMATTSTDTRVMFAAIKRLA